MAGRASAIAGCFVLSAWVLASSCRGCDDNVVGELLGASARVERDFSASVNTWQGAHTGDRFAMGDGLRTGPSASAQLGLARGGRLLIKGDTTMRFTRAVGGAAPGSRIEVEQGEITVETGQLDFGVSTPRGVVKLSAASQVQVRASAGKIRFDVMVGRAEFGEGEGALLAQAGRGFEITVLAAQAEPSPEGAGSEAPAPAPAPAAAEDDGTVGTGPALRNLRFQESPPTAAFTLPAGETATIHDPLPPTDVRVLGNRCPGLAVAEFDRGNGRFDAVRVRGTGEMRARVPAGAYRYRVRCVRGDRLEANSVAHGRVSVVRDVATRPLPSQPVAITADADGRRYTVSYQNRLPVITLRWPEAPVTNAYTLTVSPDHGTPFSIHSGKPSVTLAAGRLWEGTHAFRFEGGGKSSAQGQLRVAFDFKARTAYLTSPSEGQRAEGRNARVAGGTLIGSSVQVQGVPMKVDSQGRFAAEVSIPESAKGLVVRVQHPSTGIHYYVRHLIGGESSPAVAP